MRFSLTFLDSKTLFFLFLFLLLVVLLNLMYRVSSYIYSLSSAEKALKTSFIHSKYWLCNSPTSVEDYSDSFCVNLRYTFEIEL